MIYEPLTNVESIRNLAIDVFNYFNGKVNSVNFAQLNISYDICLAENGSGRLRLGMSYKPNVVVIYVSAFNYLLKDYDSNYVKFQLIQTIIHELFHTDQIVNQSKYNENEEYCQVIEVSTDAMTCKYMASYKEIIAAKYGIDVIGYMIRDDECKQLLTASVHDQFKRTDFLNNIFNMISSLTNDTTLTNEFVSALYDSLNNGMDIYIKIGGTELPLIQDRQQCINIRIFNQIMYNYCFKYDKWKVQLGYDIFKEINKFVLYIELLEGQFNMVSQLPSLNKIK